MEAPRPLRSDELGALGAMYGGRKIETLPLGIFMHHNPNLFNLGNLDNMQILTDGERICSHVGLNRFDIVSMGCTFSAGCIGGVHTHEDFRGKGLATQLLLQVFDNVRTAGGDFLVISGRRGLYYRTHCMIVGTACRFALVADQADSLSVPHVEVVEADGDMAEELARIHALDPVRVLRPKPVWDRFRVTRSCHFAPARTLIMLQNDTPVAYLIAREEHRDGMVEVHEFAGDRRAVAGAVGHLLRLQEVEKVSLTAMAWDTPLIAHLQAHGIQPSAQATDGTIHVINFEQTLGRFRPRLAELLGPDVADAIFVETKNDEVTFGLDSDRITLAADAATRLLFGAPPDEQEPDLGASPLAAALRKGFPIPLPTYGMDYV
ncbi:MAG: GNAT family N-acetyltransferase [Planctomycetes bacterium]|nr:GNAT family N-acetyltransferase [Planctomycetota bacterium]